MASYRDLVAVALLAIDRFSERLGGEQNVSIVGIPHDRRQNPSDRDLLLEVERHLPTSTKNLEMKTLPDTASAGVVKAVCGQVNLLLTGRMHAAIAALGMGSPVMPIDNQGKVRGLLDHFQIPEQAVSRELLNQPDELAERLFDSALREQDLRQTISDRWPYVRALSLRNFERNARGKVAETALLEPIRR
jgi:polysaccharide pyruvyl transferase WcaK-like protein